MLANFDRLSGKSPSTNPLNLGCSGHAGEWPRACCNITQCATAARLTSCCPGPVLWSAGFTLVRQSCAGVSRRSAGTEVYSGGSDANLIGAYEGSVLCP